MAIFRVSLHILLSLHISGAEISPHSLYGFRWSPFIKMEFAKSDPYTHRCLVPHPSLPHWFWSVWITDLCISELTVVLIYAMLFQWAGITLFWKYDQLFGIMHLGTDHSTLKSENGIWGLVYDCPLTVQAPILEQEKGLQNEVPPLSPNDVPHLWALPFMNSASNTSLSHELP